MPRNQWSPKRERQYEHIKEGLKERGEDEDTAEEIAARTVNKDRAQHGESKTASPTSLNDISPGRRGGLRSHRGEGGRTYAAALRRSGEEERQGPLDHEQGSSSSARSAGKEGANTHAPAGRPDCKARAAGR